MIVRRFPVNSSSSEDLFWPRRGSVSLPSEVMTAALRWGSQVTIRRVVDEGLFYTVENPITGEAVTRSSLISDPVSGFVVMVMSNTQEEFPLPVTIRSEDEFKAIFGAKKVRPTFRRIVVLK